MSLATMYRPGLRSVGLGAAVTFGTLLAASALYQRNKVTLASIWRSIYSSLGLGPDKDAPRLVTVRRVDHHHHLHILAYLFPPIQLEQSPTNPKSLNRLRRYSPSLST